jgi:hypothetical protein
MIEKWLVSGCDERITLNPQTQKNKYHLNPMEYDGLFMRGSCTCGTLTPDGHQTALRFEKDYKIADDLGWIKQQCRRIQSLFTGGTVEDFHVYFGPSGSDLMYWPLIIQSLLHPGQKIINIVSCPEELGSGSILASEGRFFAQFNQFDNQLPKGEFITPHLQVETLYLPAREASGHIAKRRQAIKDILLSNKGKPIICNLVFGSKSGIKDDFEVIEEFPHAAMWVVDLCQFRVNPELINKLLSKGVMLMVTGSKFFQSPPFCGALLVPKFWTEQIQNKPADHLAVFGKLFSARDAPPELNLLRKNWPDVPNIGLRIRWEIALDEMEAYLSYPLTQTEALINEWNELVTNRLSSSDFFCLMPDMQKTNPSIVSFTVQVGGRELNYDELRKLFDELVLNNHPGFEDFHRVFLGQPVRYANHAFIRLALGSFTIRYYLKSGKLNPFNDLCLIDLIEQKTVQLFPL